jgi:hypothetical protein
MDLAKRLEIAFVAFALALGGACADVPVEPEPDTGSPTDPSCLSPGAPGTGCFYPRATAPTVGAHFSASVDLPRQTSQGSELGILRLTGRGENSEAEAIGAARALEPLGIPYRFFSDVAAAKDFEVIQVGGSVAADDLSVEEIATLQAYVEAGGTLILYNVSDPDAFDLAGIERAFYDPTHARLDFLDVADPILTYLDHPNERSVLLSDGVTGIQSREHTCTGTVLATYDNGSHAICRHRIGAGTVYTVGIRPKIWQLFRQNWKTSGLDLDFTGHFHPTADIPSLMLRGLYEAYTTMPQLRAFAPPTYRGVLVVTHDVDDAGSVENLPRYWAFEREQGVGATYFIQTATYSTGYTSGFYGPETVQVLSDATDFDLGSHSFGHFRNFDECAPGSGEESAGSYLPTASGAGISTDCTVLGELGVSRYLLEEDLGVGVEHFRAGHLVVPPSLPASLARLGYRRDTSTPAGYTGAFLPFVQFEYQSPEIIEYPVMEYPISISDNKLGETNVQETVEHWREVLAANAANGMPTVLLVHPSDRSGRLEALEQFIRSVNDGSYWITDLESFADFWEGQGVLRRRLGTTEQAGN